jgi:NAD(P)-dependent dehydrogenase (short-subunit alcohol dehydrogenase family)
MWTKENIPRLTGKTAIVTGANAGVGYETALALYEAGAHVVLACRSMENAEIAIAKIMKSSYGGSLEGLALDLSSLQSVATAAATFTGKHSNLNILINNAGVMYPPVCCLMRSMKTRLKNYGSLQRKIPGLFILKWNRVCKQRFIMPF